MPRKKSRHYLGNPQFQHLHIEDELVDDRDKEVFRHHEIKTGGPSYQLERRGSDGRLLPEPEEIGSQEDDDLQAGSSGGVETEEQSEPFQRLGRQSRGGRGGGSPSKSRPRTSMGSPERELRVRLTRKLSSRMHAIRRFVDFTISNSDSTPRMFSMVKDEQDISSVKNGDFLFRVRLTFVPKRVNVEDPYVKENIFEIKFRGRLFKYNEQRDSFVELAVVSQCMAIGGTAELRRSPIEAAISIAPPDDDD